MLYLGEWATNLTYTPRLYHENAQGPIVVSLPGRNFQIFAKSIYMWAGTLIGILRRCHIGSCSSSML